MITFYWKHKQHSVPKAKYLTEKSLLCFLCSTLNNLISVRRTLQHHRVVRLGYCTLGGERRRNGNEGFISWIWCECEIKLNWYLTTFECVAFGHFKGNVLHMKCIWNEGNFLRQLSGVVHCSSPERIVYPFPLEESRNKLATAFILLHLSTALDSSDLVCNQ